MNIKSVTNTNVVTIGKTATLKDASSLMQNEHVGSLIVMESQNGKRAPAGIITDRDIALSLSTDAKPLEQKVENIMQSHPITVKSEEGIFEAVELMSKNGIKRLPVVNDDGSLYGIVCVDDLLGLISDEINNLAKISDSQIKNEQGFRLPERPSIL